MKFFATLAALAILCCGNWTMASEQCYRDWMSERANITDAGSDPSAAATALLFLQHLCGTNQACFSDARWQTLDNTARGSSNPIVLATATNVSSYRNEHDNTAPRWTDVAQHDEGNAYPLLLEAAAYWKAGERDRALGALNRAAHSPRFDDYLADISGFVYRRVQARPPTTEQLHPCALAGHDEHLEMSEAERTAAEVFDISMGAGAPARIGDLIGLCKQEPQLDQERAKACMAVGKLMAEHAPSELMVMFGFALQRFSTNDADTRTALLQHQQDELDELHRKLWWTDSAEGDVRAQAIALWMRDFVRIGELRAADSLIERFGEPPHEDRVVRQARFDNRMKSGQECYARYHHDS